MKRLLIILCILSMVVPALLWAGTLNYNWIYIPKYPDPESENYPIYMDNFFNDVDEDLWNVNSTKLTADTLPPATPACNAPTTGVETNNDGSAYTWLQMTWGAVAGSDLREYEVRVKKDAETAYTYSYTNGLSAMFRPAVAGGTYYFDVRAIDKQGNVGSYCTQVSVVAAQDTFSPAIPTGLSLSTNLAQDNNGVTYVWVQSDWTANAEKDVTSYKLRIKEGVGGAYYYASTTTNTLRFVGLKQGVTYYVGIEAIDASGNESGYSTDSSTTSASDATPPGLPTGLSANSTFKSVWLTWTNPSDTDFDSVEVWRSTTNDSATATKVGESPGTTYSDGGLDVGQTFYYWVKSRDWSGNTSGLAPPQYSGVSATTGSVGTTDITNFAINASKQFTKIPVLENDSWTDNSPSAGYVTWNAHQLYYNGVAYPIAAGNSNQKYIYWSGLGNTYAGAATLNDGVGPTLNDYEFIIATNINGVHDLAWNAVANQVIGSAFIQDAAIVNAKIANLAVDNEKINDLSATKINAGSLQSLNWSGTVGSQYNINDGTFYLGGSANPKLSWNGSALTVKGNISVESGQTFSCATACVDGTHITDGSISAAETDTNIDNGVSRANAGLNASGQVTKLVDTTNLPVISSGASRVVIGNDGIEMFDGASNKRVDVNTDGTFRFGNPSGDNLYWNNSTLVLTGRATIATNSDSATNATSANYSTSAGSATTATTASTSNDLNCTDCIAGSEVQFNYAGSSSEGGNANNSNDLSCTDCVADTELNNIIDLGNGGVTVRSSSAANKVQISSGGLYGYNTSGSQTFGIDASNGNAYFGPAGNQISWDGSTLTVPAAKVTGTLSAATIDTGNLTGTTITGKTIQTAASGERIVLSAGDKEAKWYDASDNLIVSIGSETILSDNIMVNGRNLYSGASSWKQFGGYFSTPNNVTVGALKGGYGVGGTATYGVGGWFEGGVGNIALKNNTTHSSVSALPYTAPLGTIMNTSDSKLFFFESGAKWQQLPYGVFGTVASNGAITGGVGFTVSHPSAGAYDISFSNGSFISAPTVIATIGNTNNGTTIRREAVTISSFRIVTFLGSAQSIGDSDFSFFAIAN